MRNPMLFRKHTGDNIYLVALRHRDENIRAPDVRIVHCERACDILRNGQHIECRLCCLKLTLFAVDYNDIHTLL